MPRATKPVAEPPTGYWGTDVTMRVIRKYARAIAERFQPDKIILFGSHAYGTPNDDSDVDLLVIMPCWNRHSQAVKIRWELPAPFPMDLLVRKPQDIARLIKEGESFHTEILTRGKVLYEKGDQGMGPQGGRRPARGRPRRSRSGAL